MQTAERAKAYRDAVDAVQEANERCLALNREITRLKSLKALDAMTPEERRAQYRIWSEERSRKVPALRSALDERTRRIHARDAAFAALKGN